MDVRPEDTEECLRSGNAEHECVNWVRLLFLTNSGHLFVCSSNAMKPQVRTIEAQSLADTDYPKTIIGICSPHDHLNTTATFVGMLFR